MPKISVIMPSLNVVEYIGKCIESVTRQTLKDIEIIIVDAGSDDGTLEIIQKYLEQDSRIRVIKSMVRSYGYQMNLGLKEAHGKYVGIVETDDVLPLDAYEKLLNYIENNNLDYVKGYPKLLWDLGNGEEYVAEVSSLSKFYKGIVCPANIPKLLCEDIYIWTGLYKKDFIKKMNFNETPGAAYQDQGFLLQTLSQAKRAMYVDELVYYYRQNNPNASQFNERGFQYISNEYRLNEDEALRLGRDWEKSFYARFVIQCLGRFERMAISGKIWPLADECITFLHEKLMQVYNDDKISVQLLGKYNYALMYLFLSSPVNIQKYFLDVFFEKYAWIKHLLKWGEGGRIVVWGCGKLGKFIQAVLLRHNVKVEAFIDSNSCLWGGSIQGSRIVSPQEARNNYLDCRFLIAVKGQDESIKEAIVEWGVKPEFVFCYQGEQDYDLLI